MIIKKFNNPEDLKCPLLKQFIQSLFDDISEDDLEHYTEQLFSVINGEDLITNDKTLIEMFNIFQKCIHIKCRT